jgi:hypothetical protein
MYRQLLRSQWKANGATVTLISLMAFATPLVQLVLSAAISMTGDPADAGGVLASQGATAGLYPVAAYFFGFTLAATTWSDDTTGKHVYALILPVPRWYYVLLRLGTGMTLLAIPVVALGIAALIGISQVNMPPGLHAYPGGLTVRFALAAGVSFAVAFAAGTASPRTLRRVGIGVLLLLILVVIVGSLGYDQLAEEAFRSALRWPSFVDAFTGRWLLIDV